ncbi:MAG TPA: hypothetical protein VK116_00355, partial [Planctomycetota bacterium]|nr:hypothetical protein [Planctomycetota bacterium]
MLGKAGLVSAPLLGIVHVDTHEGPETIALADFLELMEQASDIALRFERAGERPHALHELRGDLLLPLFNELASSANRSKSRVEHADVL